MLIVHGDNNIGVVGRNPWADQPAHNARLISLSEKESRFLADTLFWLNRIRSRALPGTEENRHSGGSTADGHASVNLFPDDAPPRLLASGTAWAMSSISGSWDADYEHSTFVNLAGLLVRNAIPGMLGKRWKTSREITRHSLATPTGERLEPRVNDSERQRLTGIFGKILEMNSKHPIPADILNPLCQASGDEALVPLIPALEKLYASLPLPDDDEGEHAILRQRFARDHFGQPKADDPADHKKDYARMQELGDKLRYHPAHVLRSPIESTLTRLRLAADPARLKQAIIDETPEKIWALTLLRRTDPATWAIFVSGDFQKVRDRERKEIFNTLAAGHPPAAADIIRTLPPKERIGLILEIARFHKEHEPEYLAADIPGLLDLIRDRDADYYQRDEAMGFLSEVPLTPDELVEFRSLLVDEIRKPVKGKETWMGDSSGSAIDALANLPDPSQHLQLVLETSGGRGNSFWSGFNALAKMTAGDPERERILSSFLRHQFTESQGFMNSIFMEAVANDLRELAPEIEGFASTSPDREDGDGGNYSGGNFKSPIGQRYHIAREITALWSEKDPATLAKMWIAFVSAHPDSFDSETRRENNHEILREIASVRIGALPADERKEALSAISRQIPISEYNPSTSEWLASLAD